LKQEQIMKFDEWLTTIPIQQTEKGVRLDLCLYVYPDGHGNFCAKNGQGQSVGNPQPVNGPAEALDVFEKIWDRATGLKSEPGSDRARKSLAEQLGDLIGSVPDLPPDMAEHHDHYLHGAPRE
jgi:hypothetical protein